MNHPLPRADVLRGEIEYLLWQLDSWAEGGRLAWSEEAPTRAEIRGRLRAELAAKEEELRGL